jgi:hypothetical protein
VQGMAKRRGRRPAWASAPLPSPLRRLPSCVAHQSSPSDKQRRGNRCRGDLGRPPRAPPAIEERRDITTVRGGGGQHDGEREVGCRRGQRCCSSRLH